MKRLILSLVSVVFAVAFVTGASYGAGMEKGKETKEAPKAEKVMGTVKSIDHKKGEMVVTPDGGGADMTFKIKKTQAKGVKEGDMVNVSYEKKGEEMTAKRVMKSKMKMKKEEKKTEEKGSY